MQLNLPSMITKRNAQLKSSKKKKMTNYNNHINA